MKSSIAKNQKNLLIKDNYKLSPFGHLFKFVGWWFGWAGLYSAFAVCPFCGQQGCPVNLASAGVVGGFMALCFQDWRKLFTFVNTKFKKKPL